MATMSGSDGLELFDFVVTVHINEALKKVRTWCPCGCFIFLNFFFFFFFF